MKGRILGADATGGMISGDDANRYRFEITQWKGERTPVAGEEVDFGLDAAGQAEGIYPLKGDVGAAIGNAVGSRLAAAEKALNSAEAGETAARLKSGLAARPQILLAVVLLLSSIAFTWLSMGPTPSQRVDVSLVGFVDFIDTIRTQLSDTVATMEQYAAQPGSSSYGSPALAVAQASARRASLTLTALKLAPVLYLIPVGAMLLLFLEYRRRRMRIVELATGVLAVSSLAFALIGREALARAATNDFSPISTLVRNSIVIGWGAWLIGIAGLGLILTALGLLRRTPGL